MVLDLVQSLFLERSFDPMEHVISVMLLWSRREFESDIQNLLQLRGYGRDHEVPVIVLVRV